jgi:predicted secreted hydrolase
MSKTKAEETVRPQNSWIENWMPRPRKGGEGGINAFFSKSPEFQYTVSILAFCPKIATGRQGSKKYT